MAFITVLYITLSSCIVYTSAESFTFEVKDTAVLPCHLSVYDTDAYWFYRGGVDSDIRMYISLNSHVYYENPPVKKRFGRRLTVRNDTGLGPSFDLVIQNLSFVDIGEYRCGYLGDDRVIKWVHVHQLNVSEKGTYDVECTVHGPLIPNIGNTVEFYCEIPPQSIYPQKQVELIWYKNKQPLFTSSGLFAPSLAVRLQRTLIESDFGAKFTCIAYDEILQQKGQCSVSSFQIPANVTVLSLTTQEEISVGKDLSLICVANGLPSSYERQFSWHLGSRQIFPNYLPRDRDESATPLDVNNIDWTSENDGEMLTFHRYHSDINGSVITCSVRSDEGIVMSSAPFVVFIPSDFVNVPGKRIDTSDGVVVSASPKVNIHETHHYTLVLAILAFVGGIVLAVCIVVFLTAVKQRRRMRGPVDELRWMPIQNTVVDHRISETFVKRHYIKPPKRLNVHERFKRRSGGDFPIASEHAHQICLRNKLKDNKSRARKSVSVSDDMYNFPLSFSDLPEFRISRSNALRDMSRSSSLGNIHLALPCEKPHYVNLPSEYSVAFQRQKRNRAVGKVSDTPDRLTLEDFRAEVGLSSDDATTNGKAGKTVTYAELDLDYLKSMEGTAAASRNDGATYAEISHSISGQLEDQISATESTAEGDTSGIINLI